MRFCTVRPCAAPCADFPTPVASIPAQPLKPLCRGLCAACAARVENAGAVGTQWLRGRKTVRDKARGSQVPSHAPNTAPQQRVGDVSCGGHFSALGVTSGITIAGKPCRCGSFPGSRRGLPQNCSEIEEVKYAQRENQICPAH